MVGVHVVGCHGQDEPIVVILAPSVFAPSMVRTFMAGSETDSVIAPVGGMSHARSERSGAG